MKKVLLCVFVLLLMSGCHKETDKIELFSREEGSGTRDMFVTSLGILKDGIDNISDKANVTGSGAVMISAVAENKNAIGYISAAAVNERVKAIAVDGDLPAEGDEYVLSRDFLVLYDENINEAGLDFLSYIGSAAAAETASEMGYFPISDTADYSPADVSGNVTVAGSASVFPLMDKLREEYSVLQPQVEVEIQQNDSSTGISLLGQKMTDIAMSSRNLRNGELGEGYAQSILARDAIAVIVHPSNKVSKLSSAQLKKIFEGYFESWGEIGE